MNNKRRRVSLAKKKSSLDIETPTAKRSAQLKGRDVHQLPSFEQMCALHLTRDELYAIVDKFPNVSMRGVFVIVKGHNKRSKRKRSPRSTVFEVTATSAQWYDRYECMLSAGDLDNQKLVTTRAGYEATKNGELFRRSIINVRSVPPTRGMYDRWVRGVDKTAFPASAIAIDDLIATVKSLRKQAGVERAADRVATADAIGDSTSNNTQED